MGWNGYGDRKGGQNAGFVVEGKVPIYSFTETPARVRFLTEDVKVEDVMSELGMVREQAEDHVATKLAFERWIMPVARWEHTIKEIPGKRYFSTVVCPGRGRCPLCLENDEAKKNGIAENKLLPYPVRKRFFVPAYFYDLKRVLFVRGAEEFFDDVASYVNRHGPDADFEIWKVGKGFNTKYKSAFVEAGAPMQVDWTAIPTPKDLDFAVDPEEWRRRVEGGAGARGPSEAAPAAGYEKAAATGPSGAAPAVDFKKAAANAAADPAEFALPFGTHKGKTLRQLFDLGEEDYLKFLAEQSSGLVQEKARAFLSAKKS